MKNFILRGFSKHLSWFRCNGKGKHLNPAARQNPAAKPLTTNTLQDFQQRYPRFRCSGKGKHLNPAARQNPAAKPLTTNTLQDFQQRYPRFRCSGKGKHLNLAQTHNSEANQLTANALQDFQRLYPWFRSMAGLECRRLQMCPGGASGWGIRQTRNRTAHASEPRQNTKDSLQFIEKLSITRIQQAHSLVQMQRQREASEPCSKAEPYSQNTHNKHIARFSATAPEVQIPGRAGMPRNANVPWRCFRLGYPPNAQQNSPCI